MEWCISWIAAWAELVRHYGADHRDVQERLKDWLLSLPGH